jgi:hypothetical protein
LSQKGHLPLAGFPSVVGRRRTCEANLCVRCGGCVPISIHGSGLGFIGDRKRSLTYNDLCRVSSRPFRGDLDCHRATSLPSWHKGLVDNAAFAGEVGHGKTASHRVCEVSCCNPIGRSGSSVPMIVFAGYQQPVNSKMAVPTKSCRLPSAKPTCLSGLC